MTVAIHAMSVKTVLAPPAFRPTWEVAVSLLGHLVFLMALVLADRCTAPPAPLFDPKDVMLVTAVSLPKQTGRMPDKAMHTADSLRGQAPDAKAPPPPPTSSDMALRDPAADPTRGADRSIDREALLNQARREQILKDMASAEGPRDQAATSPDGVDGEPILGSGGNANVDPLLGRWAAACRAAIMPNWTPLPSTVAAHPEYRVYVLVKVASDGTLAGPEIQRGTGDSSFDSSALRAVVRTGRVPPPPEPYAAAAARGVTFELKARDVQ